MGVRQQSKHELAAALQGRYLKATKTEKGRLLDECCAVTGLPPAPRGAAAAPRALR